MAADHTTLDITQCRTCGAEYDTEALPQVCPICDDDRQYLPADGAQAWVRPAEVGAEVEVVQLEPGLWGIDVTGPIGIGQQAKVIAAADGLVMVDVPAAITDEAVDAVRSLGQVRAIIPTHPHMFGLQSLWSQALGSETGGSQASGSQEPASVPVWVAAADAQWLGRRPENLELWDGVRRPAPDVTAVQPGGHFPGSAVVHWVGQDGEGVLLSGDTIAANPDRTSVSFMRSYPNKIPMSAAVVQRIARDVQRFDFARLYDNFRGHIAARADRVVAQSARRYADWVSGAFDHLTGPGVPHD